MTDFEQTRAALSQLDAERNGNANALLLAREAVRRGKQEAVERVNALEHQAKDIAGRGAGLWKDFAGYTDPTQSLPRLSDRIPILMLPLRIETRFKTGAHDTPELWVRVYPDQCLAESFEASLTEQEARNAEAFWSDIWRAGGIDADERTAWRELASKHGAGRAAWIVKQHIPLNGSDKPPRDKPTDVLLVATADAAAPAQAAAFWEKVWRAGGTEAAISAEAKNLKAVVGEAVAQHILEQYAPVNLGQAPADGQTRATTGIRYAVAQFKALDTLDLRSHSWSRAPQVRLLPERLVFMAWSGKTLVIETPGLPIRAPLAAGPDPNATGDDQLKPDGDELKIPDSILWMFDFERALSVGMAFRIPLTGEQARGGFTRIVVMGVRLADTPAEGRKRLESLIENHYYSRTGLELLPQGTATNNTEAASTGFNVHGSPDASFDTAFRDQPAFTPQSDPLLRSDGEWFARWLGISPALAQKLPNAGGRDQADARAMHLALWPGTAGYMMRTLLAPVFAEADIDSTRSFFANYVSGRGPVPALRIGAQPYGILPVTAFRDIQWYTTRPGVAEVIGAASGMRFAARLFALLKTIESEWEPLLAKVSYVGKVGAVDPHQVLLDVLGLHAGSVEFHSIKADTEASKFHLLSLLSHPLALALLEKVASREDALALLARLGYGGKTEPDVLKLIFSAIPRPLDGPVIDDSPLSETQAVSPCAGTKNYLEWLRDGARTNFDIIQEQRGFDSGREPRALLYLQLRLALQLAFNTTGHRAKARAGAANLALASYAEPAFVHVQSAQQQSESRYGVLHEKLNDRRIADLISLNIDRIDPEISEQIAAIDRLARRPTAALERVFAEHIDCLSYRLDAWKQGLITAQLDRLRTVAQEEGGTYLGVYGWLENVLPENKAFTPVQLAPEVDAIINKPGDLPLMRESSNLGLIHAPSLNHATSAAVLRNGYQANDGRMAIDLSSRRVRLASGIIEGMRAGQSLGALLGYRFERHLQDSNILQVQVVKFAIRRQFPIATNQIKSTIDTALTPQQAEAIAAKDVVDGRKLLAFVEASTVKTYPWGIATLPPAANAAQQSVLDAALAHLRDVNDAVADLALAEGVHQAVIGNYDRSAGTLEAFAKGNQPPEADVIRTPRTGTSLTLRNVIHLDPAMTANPLPGVAMTAMANAEPVLNAWLGTRLPSADDVGCSVSFVNRATGNPGTIFVRQRDIGLQPLDLVLVTHAGSDPSLGFLDDRVLQFVHATQTPSLADPITIEYTKRVAGKISFFELRALLNSLYVLTIASRPIKAGDLVRQVDVRATTLPPAALDVARLTTALNALDTVRIPALQALLPVLAAGSIDAAIDKYVTEVSKLAMWRLPQTGIGFAFDWRARSYLDLANKVRDLIARWSAVMATAKQKLLDFDGAPGAPESEQRAALAAIELLVSTTYITPPPTTVALHRLAAYAKVAAFEAEIAALQDILATRFPSYSAFLAALQAEALDGFEREPLRLADAVDEVARFREQLVATLKGLIADAQKRATAVSALLAKSPLTIELALQAAKTMFGEDFQMVPTFTLSTTAAADVTAAVAYSDAGLLNYLENTVGRDFPVDDWLHGVARVREKMRHWENALLLCDAFGTQAPAITPLQLPFEANDFWCALEIPPAATDTTRAIPRDKLLYSAHLPAAFDATKAIAGLLVDEWNEVIPEKTETTGVAFHYDRPNAEPPQCWLLAMPAVETGAWSWEGLRAAVVATLDEAQRRAIEPDQLAGTDYGWFLPATFSAYTFPEISISNYLLRNVDALAQLKDV
jgi:hypothetical protein